MSILSHSDLLRRAVAYVNDSRKDHPEKNLADIIDEAAMLHNLSPLDGEALQRLFTAEEASSCKECKG
jgi:hypothetical protein